MDLKRCGAKRQVTDPSLRSGFQQEAPACTPSRENRACRGPASLTPPERLKINNPPVSLPRRLRVKPVGLFFVRCQVLQLHTLEAASRKSVAEGARKLPRSSGSKIARLESLDQFQSYRKRSEKNLRGKPCDYCIITTGLKYLLHPGMVYIFAENGLSLSPNTVSSNRTEAA
jgi:hypothetical protein